jgi:hypothetical protein
VANHFVCLSHFISDIYSLFVVPVHVALYLQDTMLTCGEAVDDDIDIEEPSLGEE